MKPKISLNEFADHLVSGPKLNELQTCLAVAWYICMSKGANATPFKGVVDNIEELGLRHGINRTRLAASINASRLAVVRDGELKFTLSHKNTLSSTYSFAFTPPAPPIPDSVLQFADFADARVYVRDIARQVNLGYEHGLFDACAVMMRRLTEVLIIDAYEAKGTRDKILDKGNYLMLNGLIGCLLSGADFKLSRNAPKWLERLKELGDNAAHSRTYITKRLDIDEFKGSYRNLISELLGLQQA